MNGRDTAPIHPFAAVVAVLVLVFLALPIFVVIPLSFSSGEYLTFPPPGFSLRWYGRFVTDPTWLGATWLSLWVGLTVTVLAVLLGTPAAFALVRGRIRGSRVINAFILTPVIVPGIIVAIGVYFFYARLGLIGSPLGLILAHTCLAVPFVVINVSATLYGFDQRLEYAAMSLGASPLATFCQITLPLVGPGIFAGALFAFITSFDELLVALFVSGNTAVTLPRLMWDQIRFNIEPTIAAVSTLLIAFTTLLMLSAEMLRRRSVRLRSA
jgi:putative spermidine/putrescine transport system permease protein